MLKELDQILPQFDVISFDIFDTLLLRSVLNPQDVWRMVEEREGAKGFFKDRQRADRVCYARCNRDGGEPTLDGVYAQIPQWAHLKDAELELEKRVLAANPEIVRLWNKAGEFGKRRVIVSDMYLPKAFIIEVLKEQGIVGWDAIYISSDRQLKKRTGELFKLVIDDSKVVPDRILHIGDNERADVEAPSRLGIVASQYERIAKKFIAELPFVSQFLKKRPSLQKDLYVGALALGWHLYKCTHPDWTYWNRLGFLFGGTLGYFYMKWAGDHARRRGINHFMLVMRDGYILEKICKIVNPDIRTNTFYASRISALFAIRYFGAFGVGVTYRRNYCLNFLEKKFNLAFSDAERSAFVKDGKLSAETQKIFNEFSARQFDETKRYLSGFGVDEKRTALIDGTSGHFTVQRLVSSVMGHDVFTFYLQTILKAEHGESFYHCDPDEVRYLGFSEFLFGAPIPPLDHIEDGRPVFTDGLMFHERYKIDVCRQLESGAIACAQTLHSFDFPSDKLIWLDWNDAFMDNQTIDDCEHMSLAMDSIAPGHEGMYHPVILRNYTETRRLTLFGRPILMFAWVRNGERKERAVLLFGRWNVVRIRKSWLMRWNRFYGKAARIDWLRRLLGKKPLEDLKGQRT